MTPARLPRLPLPRSATATRMPSACADTDRKGLEALVAACKGGGGGGSAVSGGAAAKASAAPAFQVFFFLRITNDMIVYCIDWHGLAVARPLCRVCRVVGQPLHR